MSAREAIDREASDLLSRACESLGVRTTDIEADEWAQAVDDFAASLRVAMAPIVDAHATEAEPRTPHEDVLLSVLDEAHQAIITRSSGWSRAFAVLETKDGNLAIYGRGDSDDLEALMGITDRNETILNAQADDVEPASRELTIHEMRVLAERWLCGHLDDDERTILRDWVRARMLAAPVVTATGDVARAVWVLAVGNDLLLTIAGARALCAWVGWPDRPKLKRSPEATPAERLEVYGDATPKAARSQGLTDEMLYAVACEHMADGNEADAMQVLRDYPSTLLDERAEVLVKMFFGGQR
jgi:hypothetical protein